MREVNLQELSDCGINPFAAQLITESWKSHPSPKPVAFLLNGVPIALGYDPHELLTAAKNLWALLDSIDHSQLGEETDRVFARWEFAELRAAIAKNEPKPSTVLT